jgi:hypothetical protein
MVEREKFFLVKADDCIKGSYDLIGNGIGLIATFWNRPCYDCRKEAEGLCKKLNEGR